VGVTDGRFWPTIDFMSGEALSDRRRAVLLGAAGNVLAAVRAAPGAPMDGLTHPQLAKLEVAPGDSVFVAAFSAERQLELLGALRVGHRHGAAVDAAWPRHVCPPGQVVPHEIARGLKDIDGRGLRFARASTYELHPAALVRPMQLDEASARTLSALTLEVESSPPTDLRSDATRREAAAPDGLATPTAEHRSPPYRIRLGTRSANALLRAGLRTFEQLREIDENQLQRIRNLGAKSIAEIMDVIEAIPAEATGPWDPLHLSRPAPASQPAEGAEWIWSLGLSTGVAEALVRAGLASREAVVESGRSLPSIPGVGELGAEEVTEALARTGFLLPRGRPGATPLASLGLPDDLVAVLAQAGEQSAESLARRSARELRALPGVRPSELAVIAIALDRVGLGTAEPALGRNAAIVRERLQGATLQEIADRYGLTRERVRQIVKRHGVSREEAFVARRSQERARAEQHADRLLEAYRQGRDLSVAAREFGISRPEADAVLRERITANDRALRESRSKRTGAQPRVGDEALLEGLRRAAIDGQPPSRAEYERYARSANLPGPQTVMNRFGTWTEAIAAAGMTPTVRRRTYVRKWDAARCTEAALAVGREFGRWPSVVEYERFAGSRDDLPSSATLRTRLGAWTAIGVAVTRALEDTETAT
jgi:hypothetical protein